MILKTLKNIGITMMAVVVLCSTLSFSVHKHFCGPFLKDVSMIIPSHGCGMEADTSKDFCATSLEKSCCNDIVELIKGQDDLKHIWDNFDLEHQQFLISFTLSYDYLFSGEESVIQPYDDYAPPLVTSDIYVLDQSFLL